MNQKIPLPLCSAKGSQNSFNKNEQSIPVERPKLPNGKTDHIAAARQDPLGAVIPEIFPGFSREAHQDTARYYVRNRIS